MSALRANYASLIRDLTGSFFVPSGFGAYVRLMPIADIMFAFDDCPLVRSIPLVQKFCQARIMA